MDSIIQTFHIDIKLLLAQIINFAVVFFVLYKFAIKPLSKTMQERTSKIEKSLEDAKQIEEKLEQANIEYEKMIVKAKRQANDILDQARIDNEKKQAEAEAKARRDIGIIINEEKQKMQTEKQKVLESIKKESAAFIIESVEKVLEQKMDGKTDKELIKRIVG